MPAAQYHRLSLNDPLLGLKDLAEACTSHDFSLVDEHGRAEAADALILVSKGKVLGQ